MGVIPVKDVSEHAEGVCVSVRALCTSLDDVAARLIRADEAIDVGEPALASEIVRRLADELHRDAAVLRQFVDSFDRRKGASGAATVSA